MSIFYCPDFMKCVSIGRICFIGFFSTIFFSPFPNFRLILYPSLIKRIISTYINISSILGFAGLATATNYCASKGGVRLLTKAAALECARKTPLVRVNSIHPGFIDTPMVAGAIQRRGPEFRNYIEENVPLGELGEPNDIAEGVVYLASDGAKFVTGTELTIDGGFLAR